MNASRWLQLFAPMAFSAKPFRQRRTPRCQSRNCERPTTRPRSQADEPDPASDHEPSRLSSPRLCGNGRRVWPIAIDRNRKRVVRQAKPDPHHRSRQYRKGGSRNGAGAICGALRKQPKEQRRPGKSAVVTPTAGRSAPTLAKRRPSAPRRRLPAYRCKRPCPGKSPRGCAARRAA
jgi:hypothetical protein